MAEPKHAFQTGTERVRIRLTIGQVCRLTGLRPGTLRNWEERYRLLNPARTAGGTRLYSQTDVERIREIQGLLRVNGNSLLAVARSLQRRMAVGQEQAMAAGTLERLLELASGAEVAIGNARLLEKANLELSQAAEFEKQLHDLASALSQERSLERVADLSVAAAARIFDCESALIFLAAPGGGLSVQAVSGDRYRSLGGKAVEPGAHPELAQALDSGRVMVVNEVSRSDYRDTPMAWEFQPEAFLLAPILYGGRRLGALALAHELPGRNFSSAAPARAEILTAKVASALVNAEAFAQASQVQSSFLRSMRHQLKPVVDAIIGFSDLLGSGTAGELTPAQEHYVASIRQAGMELIKLVDGLAEPSRLEPKSWTVTEMRAPEPSRMERAV